MVSSTFIFVATLTVAGALFTGGAPEHKLQFTGCKKLSLLQRGNPANSKTIEGDDCGNVKQIIGKWAKAKQVGTLAGAASAAGSGANLASKNTDATIAAAKVLGAKIGLKDKIPESVKLAATAAEKASASASKAGSTLKTTADTFKGKFADFAKAISDDDIIKIKKETEAAIVASEDAVAAAERLLKKAGEAKKAAMNSQAGALKLIEGTLADTSKLSAMSKAVGQKATQAAGDVADLIKKSKAAAKKVDGKIAKAKEQKPVWEAYKGDLEGREKTADTSKKAVDTAVKSLGDATKDMDGKAKALQATKDKGQSSPNALLGQTKNLGDAEESIRKTDRALAVLRSKVLTMKKDEERLEDKIKETEKRLG